MVRRSFFQAIGSSVGINSRQHTPLKRPMENIRKWTLSPISQNFYFFLNFWIFEFPDLHRCDLLQGKHCFLTSWSIPQFVSSTASYHAWIHSKTWSGLHHVPIFWSKRSGRNLWIPFWWEFWSDAVMEKCRISFLGFIMHSRRLYLRRNVFTAEKMFIFNDFRWGFIVQKL